MGVHGILFGLKAELHSQLYLERGTDLLIVTMTSNSLSRFASNNHGKWMVISSFAFFSYTLPCSFNFSKVWGSARVNTGKVA